uniref:Putative DNA primase n=1 Tax=viral metagenome TaxID=1070528 RepID=A0A6M3IJM3_9ZZZZ
MWNGRYWEQDDRRRIWELAKETVRTIAAEANLIPVGTTQDEDRIRSKQRAAVLTHAVASEGKKRIADMIELAKSDIPVSTEDLDRNTWFINCENGTLDIRTGELHPHTPEDFITRMAPVVFNPAAKSELWPAFLDIVIPDPDLQHFVQKAVGYSLTGDCREEVMFFLYGSGANGKSTFVNATLELLGPYAAQVSPSTLIVQQGERPRNDLAKLRGKTFVSASEASGKAAFDEELLKRMTGQDKLVARFLFKEEFEMTPTWKVWLMSNHRPRIEGVDNAIWRRLHCIPFTARIPVGKRDPMIKHALSHDSGERSAILNWAVEGARLWLQEGLTPPDVVKSATHSYRLEMDTLGQFLEDCCAIRPDVRVRYADLYTCYRTYCDNLGERGLAQRVFTQQLVTRGDGIVETRKIGNNRFYIGIRIERDVSLDQFVGQNGEGEGQ